MLGVPLIAMCRAGCLQGADYKKVIEASASRLEMSVDSAVNVPPPSTGSFARSTSKKGNTSYAKRKFSATKQKKSYSYGSYGRNKRGKTRR